jgi:hypothetical protein
MWVFKILSSVFWSNIVNYNYNLQYKNFNYQTQLNISTCLTYLSFIFKEIILFKLN